MVIKASDKKLIELFQPTYVIGVAQDIFYYNKGSFNFNNSNYVTISSTDYCCHKYLWLKGTNDMLDSGGSLGSKEYEMQFLYPENSQKL